MHYTKQLAAAYEIKKSQPQGGAKTNTQRSTENDAQINGYFVQPAETRQACGKVILVVYWSFEQKRSGVTNPLVDYHKRIQYSRAEELPSQTKVEPHGQSKT